MPISTALACLNLVPKLVHGEREAIYEANSILDVQAEEILKPKVEAAKKNDEGIEVWIKHLPLYPSLGKYPWATHLSM